MSTTFQSIDLTGIKKADLMQLLGYIESIEDSCVYWGNVTYFNKRHERIKKLIGDAVEYAYSDSVRMPTKRKANRYDT